MSCDPQLPGQCQDRVGCSLQRHISPGEPPLRHCLPDPGEGKLTPLHTLCPAAVAQGRQPWALPGSCCGKAGSPGPCRAAAVARQAALGPAGQLLWQGRQPWALPGSCCGKAGSPGPCRAAAVARQAAPGPARQLLWQGRQPQALPGSCCGKAGSPGPCRAAAVACDWHLHSWLTSGSVPSLSAQPECNIFAYVSAEDFKRIRTVSSLACRHTVSLAYVSHSLTSTHGAYRELLSYYTWPQNYWMYIVT